MRLLSPPPGTCGEAPEGANYPGAWRRHPLTPGWVRQVYQILSIVLLSSPTTNYLTMMKESKHEIKNLCAPPPVIVSPLVHIEMYSKELELKAVEGRLVGYSNNSKSYRVYNPATRRTTESRSVIFIETPSRLFPTPLEETSKQVNLPSSGMDDHNYITDNDFLRDLHDCTCTLEPIPGASADHNAVGGL